MGGPGVVLVHTLPTGTLSSLGRMLACCEGNGHGHLPRSREHGTEQSQFGRREEREGGGVQAFNGPRKAQGTCRAAGSLGPTEQSLRVGDAGAPRRQPAPSPPGQLLSLPPHLRVASPATFPPCPLHSSHTPPSALVGGRLDPSSAPLNRRQRLIPFSGPLDRPLQPRTHIVHGAGEL